MKYTIFHVQGGVGKHVAATAVARALKAKYPDRKLIVVCAYPEVFTPLKFVDRVFTLGATTYFHEEYIKDKDSIVFYHDPYYSTDHIHNRKSLIENWFNLYDLPYADNQPELRFNKVQVEISANVWKRKKPTLVVHTNGGMMSSDAKPYSWTRDMPFDVASEIAEYFRKDYHIFQVTKMNSPVINGAEPIMSTPERQLSSTELFSILIHSDKRLLIDSSLQHAAAALNKKSTVLWVGTSPVTYGYTIHDNIQAMMPDGYKLPGSYLFDFDIGGVDSEYPFDDDAKIFDVPTIIKSIENNQ